MSTKKCLKCGCVKSLSEFCRDASRKDGLNYRCKSCKRVHNAEYWKANRQKGLVSLAAYYKANRQSSIDRATAWRHAHPERYKQHMKNTRLRHPETWERARHKRKAHLAEVEFDPTVTLDTLYQRDDGMCGICDEPVARSKASVDHVAPVSKGGSHTWDNVQLAHLICNSRKGTRVQPL